MNSLRLACVLTFAGLVATACSSESSEEGPGDFLSVLQTAPQDGTDQAPTAARIGFQIDAAIDPATLTSANFFVTDENGAPLTGTPTVLDDDSSAAELILDAPMEVITTYRATITTGLRSTGGVALEENFEWTFTTLDSAWGISEWIEEDVNGTSAEQDIAVDAQSNAIAVWEHETAAGTAIWANRYTRTDLWGEPVPIDRGSGTVARPSVATDDAGNGIAVWERINEGGVAANIWTNRYDVAAGTWGTAELLQSGEITQAEQASVAAAPSGDAVATWVQTDADTGRDVVWARTYSAGSGWGEAGLISEGIPESFLAGNSTLGMDGAGNAIAVWSRRTVDGDVIWANRYVPTGGWGEAAIIKSDPATSARRVRLSVGDAGDAFVVWIQGDGQRDDVWSTRFSGTWGEPGRIDAVDLNVGHAHLAAVAGPRDSVTGPTGGVVPLNERVADDRIGRTGCNVLALFDAATEDSAEPRGFGGVVRDETVDDQEVPSGRRIAQLVARIRNGKVRVRIQRARLEAVERIDADQVGLDRRDAAAAVASTTCHTATGATDREACDDEESLAEIVGVESHSNRSPLSTLVDATMRDRRRASVDDGRSNPIEAQIVERDTSRVC